MCAKGSLPRRSTKCSGRSPRLCEGATDHGLLDRHAGRRNSQTAVGSARPRAGSASVRTGNDKKQSRQACSVGQGSDRGIVAVETERRCTVTPRVHGYVTTEGSGYSTYRRNHGGKPVSRLDLKGSCFMIYGGQRSGIWFGQGFRNGSRWKYLVTKPDQFLIVMTSFPRLILLAAKQQVRGIR